MTKKKKPVNSHCNINQVDYILHWLLAFKF